MKVRLFWLILALFWTGFIWFNSLQSAESSDAASGNVVDLVEPILSDLGIPEENHNITVRKCAHFAEFALLGICWLMVFKEKMPESVLWALAACLITAVLDETIQRFVPGRSCELRDVALDTLGSCVGVIFGAAVRFCLRKCR